MDKNAVLSNKSSFHKRSTYYINNKRADKTARFSLSHFYIVVFFLDV